MGESWYSMKALKKKKENSPHLDIQKRQLLFLQLLSDHRFQPIYRYMKTYFLLLLVYPFTPLFSFSLLSNPCHIFCLYMSVFFLCQTLATAQGNILENRELIDSLNQTKASSALIQESLLESHRLQASLDQVLYFRHHFYNVTINFQKLYWS